MLTNFLDPSVTLTSFKMDSLHPEQTAPPANTVPSSVLIHMLFFLSFALLHFCQSSAVAIDLQQVLWQRPLVLAV